MAGERGDIMQITSLTDLREKLAERHANMPALRRAATPAGGAGGVGSAGGVVVHLADRFGPTKAADAVSFDEAKALLAGIRQDGSATAALQSAHDLDWQRVMQLVG